MLCWPHISVVLLKFFQAMKKKSDFTRFSDRVVVIGVKPTQFSLINTPLTDMMIKDKDKVSYGITDANCIH